MFFDSRFRVYDRAGSLLESVESFEDAVEFCLKETVQGTRHEVLVVVQDGVTIAKVDRVRDLSWVDESFDRPHGEHPSMGLCECVGCEFWDATEKV